MKDIQSTLLHINSKIEAAGAETEAAVVELKSAGEEKRKA